jgi:glycosyltransferase involved in cell wall biosynthesis
MSKTVLLARRLEQGGAERQLVALAKALKARGQDIEVVLFYSGGVFDSDLRAAGVPIHSIHKRGRWDVFGFLVRLVLMLRALRPVTIYSFLDLPNILAAFCHLAIGRSRLVWSIRAAGMEMRHYDRLSRLIYRMEAALSWSADAIVANSHAGKQWAVSRGFPASRIVVIENGIDTDRFRFDPPGRVRVRREWNVSEDEIAIGLVARMDVMKDHHCFLQACALLASQRDDLRFVCIGAGSSAYCSELRRFACHLGIDDLLIWAGPRTDMPLVLSALDVVCSSSCFGEGFSNAIAEAMSCERLCAVTDVGDSARIVGEVGEVVLPRDPSSMAKAIIQLLHRMHVQPDIGRQARKRIQNKFSLERMVQRTEELLPRH